MSRAPKAYGSQPVCCVDSRVLRLVYNMTQGFALRYVATGSACKMIWMVTQRRNRKFFYFCVQNFSTFALMTTSLVLISSCGHT